MHILPLRPVKVLAGSNPARVTTLFGVVCSLKIGGCHGQRETSHRR